MLIITIIARIIQIGPTARRCRSPMSPRPFATQPLWGARRGLEHWDSMTHKHGEHRSLTMFNQQTGRYSPTCFWRMDSWSTFFFLCCGFLLIHGWFYAWIYSHGQFIQGWSFVILCFTSPVIWSSDNASFAIFVILVDFPFQAMVYVNYHVFPVGMQASAF